MTTIDTPPTSALLAGTRAKHRGIPLSRIVTTEMRKMLDTRSGFWLMASIGILSLLATAAVILFAPDKELTYNSFVTAIDIPMTLVLPMIAISCVGVAVVTIPLAFGIGALGNVVGTAIAGVDPVWDLTVTNLLTIVLANVLSLLIGFMLGVVIRSSAGALVAYFVYQFLLPTLALPLATSQNWFRDLQPWVDFDHAQGALFDGALTAQQWAQLGVTGMIWLAIPLTVGLGFVTRAEVK